MAISLTERVSRIQPSATIAVSVRAAELRAAGRDVIGLGAGEPDFDTPDHIKQAAWEAIQRGETKYTAVDGIKELKEAVQAKFKRDHDLDYALDEIMVSAGAKHTLMNILISVIEEGDEVLIPCPYWASYGDMTRLVDGEPKLVKCGLEQHFKITPEQLRDNLNAPYQNRAAERAE